MEDETKACKEKDTEFNGSSESENLLKPQFEVYWNLIIGDNLEPPVSPDQSQGPTKDEQVKVKIKKLEMEIASCKRLITKYDEEEVDLDSTSSSYIKSEK